MGFIKKIWKDRISEFPTRRSLTKTDGASELVTVARSEGMISEEGDAFSAENMNDFENRVANGFNELNEKNAIETLSYTSNVSNYFMQFYKQGNHVWGSALSRATVFSDKTTIAFSPDNYNGKKVEELRIFCKIPGNILLLNENVQHIIGVGIFRYDRANNSSTYPTPAVAIYNGTDTEIRVSFTGLSDAKDIRYEFTVDTVL